MTPEHARVRSRRRARRRARRRGATLLFFLLFALPLLTISAMLGVDFTRIVIINRETSNATGAAALAGAQQYVPNKAEVDPLRARDAAVALLGRAQSTGVLSSITLEPTVTPTAREVAVTTRYRIDNLVFIPVVLGLFGASERAAPTYAVTRTATICVPGEARSGEASRLQSCTRPKP